MDNPHANHQGEPGGTGWSDLSPQEIVRRTRCQADDWSAQSAAGWRECCDLILNRLGPVSIASAPTPLDRVGEEVGRLAKLAEIPPAGSEERKLWLKQAKRHYFTPWRGTYTADPEQVLTLMSEARKQGQWDVLASAPSPKAGAGGDLGELERLSANLSHLRAAAVAVLNAWNHPHDLDVAGDALEAAVRATPVGKLVASTGSGEETKGASFGPGSCPSGPTASRSSGFAAAIPSRTPTEPCVQWSAWSETDADSDPSDPGVTYCTEWFVGRWPVGAEEPDCRILIGTSRSAEIIARRIAERLTSILNTDRLHSADAASSLDTLRPMSEAPTGVPIIAKHKPNAAMPHGWVATIKLGHGDDEEAGFYDTILHYNGEESFRGFRGMWTGWLPMGALAGEAEGRDRQGSVHEHAAPQGATPEATPKSSPDQTPVDPQELSFGPGCYDFASSVASKVAALPWAWAETGDAQDDRYSDVQMIVDAELRSLAPSDAPSTTGADR